MRPILAAFQFLTAIPIPARLREIDFERAPVWFPLVGLSLGGLTVLADAALGMLGCPVLARCVLSVAFLAALSGGLHLDGLADTADGFLSARPRERALEIMRDSHIGTMGVLALILVLGLKIAALAALEGPLRRHALLLAPLAGRCVLTAAMVALPYARGDGGLASVFLRSRRKVLILWAVLWFAVGAAAMAGPTVWFVWCLAALAASAAFSLWSLRRIGGFTGDTLGATGEIVEATILLVACWG